VPAFVAFMLHSSKERASLEAFEIYELIDLLPIGLAPIAAAAVEILGSGARLRTGRT
jgi:hypothetical protein